MQNLYTTHPAEEALERFLLHQCPDEELETVETHILACDGCVSRLEALETQIAATKIALNELEHERTVAVAAKQHRSWKTWFTVPTLSWAGASAAVVAAGLLVTPQLTHRNAPAEVSLSTYRGLETSVVPEGRRLHLHFNAAGLPQGPVTIQLVDEMGAQLWTGTGVIRNDQVEASAPKITHNGAYLFRLYAAGSGHAGSEQGELLREFSFQVK